MPAIFKIYQRGVNAHRETFFDTKQVTWVKNAAKSTYQMKGQARQMFKSNEFILKKLSERMIGFIMVNKKKRSQGATSLK